MTIARQVVTMCLCIASAILCTIGITYIVAYYWFAIDTLKICSAIFFFVGSCGFAWIARGRLDKLYPHSNGLWRQDNFWAVIFGLCYILCLIFTLVSIYFDFILK